MSKSVIHSTLFKAAMFGADANWGRVLCAIGYAGADIDINKVDVSFKSAYGQVDVCVNGAGINFSEEEAAKVTALYQPKKEEPKKDAPKKEHDHAMDEMRYFAMDLSGGEKGGFAAVSVARGRYR